MGFCLTRDELTLFSANTCLENDTKTQRTGIVKSSIAIDYPHSRNKTAQHSLHHGRPFATEAIQKIPNASCNRIWWDRRAHNLTRKFPTKTVDTQLSFSCSVIAALGHNLRLIKKLYMSLDHERTRDRNNCKCRSTSNCNWWNSSHIFSRSRVLTLGTNAHLHPGVRSQLTHLPHHTQSRLGALCPISDELTVFSTNASLMKSNGHNSDINGCSRVFSFARQNCATPYITQHCSHMDASRNSKRARGHVTEFHRTEIKPKVTFFWNQTKKKHINDKRRRFLKTHTTYSARKWNTINETNKNNKFEAWTTRQFVAPMVTQREKHIHGFLLNRRVKR